MLRAASNFPRIRQRLKSIDTNQIAKSSYEKDIIKTGLLLGEEPFNIFSYVKGDSFSITND